MLLHIKLFSFFHHISSVVFCSAELKIIISTGPDWEWGDQDGGEGSIGVVYRVNDVAVVHVSLAITQTSYIFLFIFSITCLSSSFCII